ncbi:EscU/YscU/HrcU family type III secretion system export apparatus switch protein [Citrobacter freundii]|nr:EscU/YscU/HrcU family type III secretion system export apparatus switch protein [Citrobacter freundii]
MSGEKTLPPTKKKIHDARKEGQVASTPEVASGLQLAIILAYFFLRGKTLWTDLSALVLLTMDDLETETGLALERFLSALGTLLLKDFCLLGGLLLVGTFAAYQAQIGFLFSPRALIPKPEKLNPVHQFKNLFGAKALVGFLKNLGKLLLMTGIFWYLIRHYAPSFQNMVFIGPVDAMTVTVRVIFWLWGALVLCYVVFALADYAWSRHELRKQLRMSQEDMKQEHKDMEGNDEIKNERQARHKELQSGSLENTVRGATAVIRNPTHLAVCILYDEHSCPVPRVVAKGRDWRAREIVRLAEQAGIPVIENVPLARGLMKDIPVNQYISPSFFAAVAELLWMVKTVQV